MLMRPILIVVPVRVSCDCASVSRYGLEFYWVITSNSVLVYHPIQETIFSSRQQIEWPMKADYMVDSSHNS